MKNLQLFLLTLITQKCYSEFVPLYQLFNPHSDALASMCPPTKQHQTPQAFPKPIPDDTTFAEGPKDNLKFLLPFLDMQIECDRSWHIIQEQQQKQQIYLLHGHALYQLFVERQEKRLVWMGILEGSVRHVEPLGAQIIHWQGSLLLVIALDEHLEVYQLAENVLLQRAAAVKDPSKAPETPPVFEAIQQLTLTGKFNKLFLFSPSKERIMIVAAVNFTHLHGKLRIFEWFNTYFDPVEEMLVPGLHVVNIIGSHTKYLITGRTIKHQPQTILNVYEITANATKFSMKQTLTVESRVVHIFTYQRRNMIVACSSDQQKCNSFRQMADGHFSVYRQRTAREFAFDQVASSPRFIAASRQNQIMIFTNHRLDCFGSFVSDEKDMPSLMGLENANKEIYLLLVYKRPLQALVRIVELEMSAKNLTTDTQSEPEEMLLLSHHEHLFEQTIGRLRSLLLRRKSDMDVFRKLAQFLKLKLKHIESKEPITLHGGSVGVIKVIGESLRNPAQIVQKIESLRKQYLPQRAKRAESHELFNVTNRRIRVKKMKVENLLYHGDLIEGFSTNLTDSSNKVLNISTKVTSRFLNTTELILPRNKSEARQNIPDVFFDSAPLVRINHLKVDSINGQPWNAFYDSLFLKNRDTFIEGNVVLQSPVKVRHLTTKMLNGLAVANLFNLKHPQIIHSDLVISRFFANNLKANTINGLDFAEDIVFSGNDTLIETPVTINHLRISGDVFLANNIKLERSTPHEIEFQQFYTNKVTINGSLFVHNLKRLNNGTKMILDDQEFNENEVKGKYLLRGQAQNFSFPVTFEEAKVTAPSLETAYVNDHPTEQHLLVNKLNSEKPLVAVFMNAQVQGNVTLRDFKSRLAEIKENIIRRGDKVNITGHKIFAEPVEINNAEVLTLNELPVKDLVFKHQLKEGNLMRFKDAKIFAKVEVNNSTTIDRELKVSYLNNLPLENLLSNDYYLERLKLDYLVDATNLVFHKLNGIPFDDFFAKLKVQNGRLILHKDVIIEGNAQFEHAFNVEYINGVNWNEYLKSLVRVNESAVIEGEVYFDEDLTITREFETSEINGEGLENILKNVLLKSQPQLITGSYQFDYLVGSHVDVARINNIDFGNFVDLSKNFTEIESDIVVENLNIEGNLQGYLNEFEFLLQAKDKIQQLPLRPWKRLYVVKNASWPSNVADNDQHELLKYFYKSAVLANHDQTISGNIKMSYPVINNMQTRFKFPSNLDLEFIQQDAVLRRSAENQQVKGAKTFLTALRMESLKAFKNVDTKLLNEIDVLRFNQSLYYKTSPELLKGPMKFLKPLEIKHLLINDLINGRDSSGIYQLQPEAALPAVQLQQLFVTDNLTITNINDMNWAYFLDNRVALEGPPLEHFGHLTFEHLIIEKQALIRNINGIAFDNLVFKNSAHLQTITGHKNLQNSLVLDGPAHVTHINDEDLMELHRNSLLKEQNYEFESLELEQAEFEKGLQVLYHPHEDGDDDHKLQRFSGRTHEVASRNDLKFLTFLKEFQHNISNTSKSIIYLDYDLNTTITWLDAAAQQISANLTIHHELSRVSCCERRYIQVSLLLPDNIVYLRNLTNHSLLQSAHKISIKAENYCLPHKRQVKSKISLSGPKLLKVFFMKRFIETLHIFIDNVNSGEKFVILHALDMPSVKRNEVRIFKISLANNSIHNWQSLTQNIGQQLKYFNLSHTHILLTNGLVDHHPAVTIYHFQDHTQLFKVQQVIDGDFDIMEMLEIPNSSRAQKQLILSCAKCKRIFIYETVSSQKDAIYEVQQIISLKSALDKLVIFNLSNSFYMLVISQPGYGAYNIYKYSYIQGWLPQNFGYFPSLQLSLPLTELWTRGNGLMLSQVLDGLPLMLLCQPSNCYVVKAIV